MAAVKTEDLAARLVDEAGRILSAEGAAALSLRRLAAATGTSTMAVYTRFGDKQGLLAAMYRAGFERLGAAMSVAVDGVEDPLSALAELGLAYRRAALANPHLYDLMFGRPVAAFEPDPDAKQVAESAYRPLVDAVRRCMDSGAMVVGDAERVASYLWAVTHGMVSLDLAGQLRGDAAARDAAYTDALVFSSLPFLP
ncbi:MAG: TetR family transcriptional regulator [Frankiales bacterium]|nr:TetR family transcriptional regulator [Frankiales bacterium]